MAAFDPFQTELCAALLLDADGEVLRAGEGCRGILSARPDELEGRSTAALFAHPDRIAKGIRNVLAGAPSAIVRTQMERRDETLSVVLRMQSQQSDGGLVVLALVEDVSGRAAVLESASQMQSLVDFAADAWFVHDMEGRLRDANPWAAASLGYSREEMLALVVSDFETTIQPGRLDGVWNRMDIGKPISVQGRHRRKDGSEFPVSVRLGLFETVDGEVLMLAICRDITEMKETEARLARLNETLEEQVEQRTAELAAALAERQAILENLADGLIAFDTAGTVQVANPAAAALFQGEALETGLPAALVGVSERALVQRDVLTEELSVGEGTLSVVVSPTFVDDALTGGVALIRDVTLEREVDRMKTDFIATVSHELRTPLTSVLGFAKITRNKLASRVFPLVPEADRKATRAIAQSRKNLDIIVSEGERLTALINDVLDISKMEAGRMEWRFAPTEVAPLVDRAASASASLFEGEVAFDVVLGADLPVVKADEDRILQVLINLISNAAKFTEAGRVVVEARRLGAGVELSVTDTGRGIDAPSQSAVFDKFKQVGDTLTDKPRGTGLGLPICAQIVAAHGSQFSLQSALGEGSRFAFVLGETAGEPSIAPVAPTPTRKVSGDGILVVDDDPNLRELLRQQLTERGYAVRLAANGYEAIRMARESRPALVVLDVMMPVLSGFDVAAMLRNDPAMADLPILILSIVRDEERGYSIGVDRYITKPADADALAVAVAELLQTESPAP